MDAATKILADDPEWVVPEIWRTEVLSVFRDSPWGTSERPFEGRSTPPASAPGVAYQVSPRISHLGGKLTIHDAGYVAVAESHDLTLVTADVCIAKAGVARCPVRTIN